MSDLKQINARIPLELHDALAAHKERTGEEKSAVVVRGIELALGQEPTPPSQDVDALIASLAELRRQKRLNLKYLVAELNEKLGLGPEASQQDPDGGNPPSSPPADDEAAAAMAESAGVSPAEPEHREGGGSGDSTSDSSTADEGARMVDFPTWLSGRTGMPRALCRLRVLAGHVEIDGQRYQEESVPAALLAGPVSLNGEPV